MIISITCPTLADRDALVNYIRFHRSIILIYTTGLTLIIEYIR